MAASAVTANPKELAAARQRRVDAARDMVVCDPEIMSGMPVIKGTRVLVYDIAGFVSAGDSIEEILQGYKSLNREQVELAVIFAEECPNQTEPYHFELPAGATLIYSYTEPSN